MALQEEDLGINLNSSKDTASSILRSQVLAVDILSHRVEDILNSQVVAILNSQVVDIPSSQAVAILNSQAVDIHSSSLVAMGLNLDTLVNQQPVAITSRVRRELVRPVMLLEPDILVHQGPVHRVTLVGQEPQLAIKGDISPKQVLSPRVCLRDKVQ